MRMFGYPSIVEAIFLSFVLLLFAGCKAEKRHSTNKLAKQESIVLLSRENAESSIFIGDALAGMTAVKEVTLKNALSSDIKILHVAKSCTCTGVQLEREIVRPNGSTVLKIEFPVGAEEKIYNTRIALSLASDSGEKWEQVINLSVKSDALVLLNPSECSFGAVQQTQNHSLNISIKLGSLGDLVRDVEPDNVVSGCKVNIERVDSSNFIAHISLEKDSLPIGVFSSTAKLKLKDTHGEVVAEAIIPVTAEIYSDVIATPNSVVAKLGNGEYTKEFTFQIKDSSGAINSIVPKFIHGGEGMLIEPTSIDHGVAKISILCNLTDSKPNISGVIQVAVGTTSRKGSVAINMPVVVYKTR